MKNIPLLTIGRILMTGFVATAIAACAQPTKPEGHDYRQTHPIKVASEQVSTAITLPLEGTALSPGDGARFKSFLRDYVQRGRTVVTVESQQPALARAVLLAHGLLDGEILLVPKTTVKAPNAVLSFTASKVIAPECGDWSGPINFDPQNRQHSNYGCSYQRNTAQTIADPGDLIQAKPASGGNASRSDSGIFTHQSGETKTRLLDGGVNIITGQ